MDSVNHHLLDVTKGVICRPKEEFASINFLLPPRETTLTTTASLSHEIHNEQMWLALSALKDVQTKGHSRGAGKQVIMEEGKKYFSVGTQSTRAGRGIRSIHHSLMDLSEHHCKIILKQFKGVEHLYLAWMDTKEIRQVTSAIRLVHPKLFRIDDKKETSSPTTKTASIYGAMATGRNVYLNSHTDKDFTLSAVMLCMRKAYEVGDSVVGNFCFPSLGIVVPLRPGDVLFFNPRVHHCVSSRCHNADDMYALSLYLKSGNIGLHDNSIQLLFIEKFYLGKSAS